MIDAIATVDTMGYGEVARYCAINDPDVEVDIDG